MSSIGSTRVRLPQRRWASTPASMARQPGCSAGDPALPRWGPRFTRWLCATLVLVSLGVATSETHSRQKVPDYKNARLPVEQRVADLLSRMTLEEKVAQLVCLWGGRPQVGPQGDFSTDRGDFSPDKARL